MNDKYKAEVSESYSFKRPSEMVGEHINMQTMEEIVRRLCLLPGISEADAVAAIGSVGARHTFDALQGKLQLTAEERIILAGISERIAKAAVDQMIVYKIVPAGKARQHSARTRISRKVVVEV